MYALADISFASPYSFPKNLQLSICTSLQPFQLYVQKLISLPLYAQLCLQARYHIQQLAARKIAVIRRHRCGRFRLLSPFRCFRMRVGVSGPRHFVSVIYIWRFRISKTRRKHASNPSVIYYDYWLTYDVWFVRISHHILEHHTSYRIIIFLSHPCLLKTTKLVYVKCVVLN